MVLSLCVSIWNICVLFCFCFALLVPTVPMFHSLPMLVRSVMTRNMKHQICEICCLAEPTAESHSSTSSSQKLIPSNVLLSGFTHKPYLLPYSKTILLKAQVATLERVKTVYKERTAKFLSLTKRNREKAAKPKLHEKDLEINYTLLLSVELQMRVLQNKGYGVSNNTHSHSITH